MSCAITLSLPNSPPLFSPSIALSFFHPSSLFPPVFIFLPEPMLVHLALIYFLRWEDLAEDEREKAKRKKERLSTSWRLSAKAFCNKKKHTVTEKNMVIEGNILIHRGKRKRRQRG